MEEVEESFISWTVNPQKSINDVNEYRYVILKNKLRALLISCPKDKNQTWVQAGVVYAAEDGPELLRTGATSRANNFASEFFFAPRRKKKEKSKENEGSDVKMELEENKENEEEKEENELEENEEKEYELKINPEEDEDTDTPEKDANSNDTELCDMDPDEILNAIKQDDSLNEIFNEVMSEPEVELNLKSLTDVNVLASQMIPVDLSQIVAKEDDGFQLVFQNKNTPVVLNGDAAITFPVGSLYDPPELKGISDLSRKVIADLGDKILPVTSTGLSETMSTFVKQHEQSEDIESSLAALLNALQNPKYKQEHLKDLLCNKNYPPSQDKYEIVNKMDSRSWLLNDKKQLQFIYSLAKNNHSFQNVSPGFRQGLMPINEDCKSITEGLEKLWQTQYSKELATVVLQSSESLDTLQHVLVKHLIRKNVKFPDANDRNTVVPLEEPFSMTTFAKLYRVCYKGGDSATPSLVISWALDPALWKNYRSKPLDHVAWLLSHKLEGGLRFILHKRGLITDLQAGCNHTGYHRNNWCSLFQINLQLSEKGFNLLDRIVPLITRYISYLDDLDIETHGKIYQYLKYTREISFNSNEPEISQLRDMEVPFSHFTNSAPRVGALAEAMQKFPPEDVLMGDILLFGFEPDVIKRVLQSLLLPNRCNYMLSYKIYDFEHEEKYYKTKYIMSEIPTIWVDRSKDLTEKITLEIVTGFASPNLHYTEYELGATLLEGENLPLLVLQSGNINVWLKNSYLYKSMVSYMAHIACPLLSNYSPERSVMVSMLVNELNERVTNEGLDAGNIANLYYSIEPTHFGVLVKVFGHKSLTQTTCKAIFKNLEVALVSTNPKKHNLLLKRKYNSALARPEVLAKCFLNQLTVRNYVSLYSRLETLKNVDEESYVSFAVNFRRECEVRVLVAGAIDVETYQMSEWFPGETNSSFSYPEAMMYIWPVGIRILRVLSNYMEKNQIFICHQFQMRATLENRCNCRIFHEFIGMAVNFESIRITCQVNEFNGVIHFEISGSALNLAVDSVDKALNNFLADVIRGLDKHPDIFQSWWTTDCTLLKKRKCESYSYVIDQMQDYERKVKDCSFNFDCDDASAQAAQYSSVNHKTFLHWVEKYFDSDGKEQRKMSIQIVNDPVKRPQCVLGKRTNSQTTDSENNVNKNGLFRIFTPKSSQSGAKQFIGDVSAFTNSLNLYNIVNHRTHT